MLEAKSQSIRVMTDVPKKNACQEEMNAISVKSARVM